MIRRLKRAAKRRMARQPRRNWKRYARDPIAFAKLLGVSLRPWQKRLLAELERRPRHHVMSGFAPLVRHHGRAPYPGEVAEIWPAFWQENAGATPSEAVD